MVVNRASLVLDLKFTQHSCQCLSSLLRMMMLEGEMEIKGSVCAH